MGNGETMSEEVEEKIKAAAWPDLVASLRGIVDGLRKSGYANAQIYDAIQPMLTNSLRAVMMGE
jgi:hypothetical protein